MATPSDMDREMYKFLTILECDVDFFLRNVERMNHSLNDEFHRMFIRKSNQRLETTYAKIRLELSDTNRDKNRSLSSNNVKEETIDSNGMDGVVGESEKYSCADSLTIGVEMKQKPQNGTSESNAVIEINDSSDDEDAGSLNDATKRHTNGNDERERHSLMIGETVNENELNESENRINDEAGVKQEANSELKHEGIDNTAAIRKFNAIENVNRNANAAVPNDGAVVVDEVVRIVAPSSSLISRSIKTSAKKSTKIVGSSNTHTDRSRSNIKNPFKCQYCDHVAAHSANLLRHIRSHTGEKPYQCSRCVKTFTKSESPFHCRGCFNRFSTKTKRENHEKVCRNRRYECHLCKTFITNCKTQAQLHLRSKHSGDSPFQCLICKKIYMIKSHLNRHSKKVHSGTNKN